MRATELSRKTGETDIHLHLNLDGEGRAELQSGNGFFDHMLALLARHGGFDLTLRCQGDIHVDDHHSIEDIGICLGEALREALGDLRGVQRYGHSFLPMDEALVLCAVDLSGRGHLSFEASIPAQKVGDFDTELVEEFLLAFVRTARITLHIRQFSGRNTHHIIEAMFKALARALKMAVALEPGNDEIPSTKGML